jgi:hypothetical protein
VVRVEVNIKKRKGSALQMSGEGLRKIAGCCNDVVVYQAWLSITRPSIA